LPPRLALVVPTAVTSPPDVVHPVRLPDSNPVCAKAFEHNNNKVKNIFFIKLYDIQLQVILTLLLLHILYYKCVLDS
jgi:hypothetical protein